MNIIKEEDDLASPAQKKHASKKSKKFTYADIYGNMFKDSGVNGLIIIAAVERVSESYHNLQTILELVGLESAEIGTNDFINADDCELALTALGLGPVGSKHNCMFCDCDKDLFDDPDCIYVGGNLRTSNGIREFANQYQEAAGNSRQKTKLSSAPWFNCEHPPLCLPHNGEEDVVVIDALAPGVSNAIYIQTLILEPSILSQTPLPSFLFTKSPQYH